MATTQPVDGASFQKAYNFFIKYENATYWEIWSTLDTPGMMCSVLF